MLHYFHNSTSFLLKRNFSIPEYTVFISDYNLWEKEVPDIFAAELLPHLLSKLLTFSRDLLKFRGFLSNLFL